MRIISGKHRGAKLFAPADNRVRPTSDRVKESVFNILCGRVALDSANVLDLFAGSGALGLETYSRGAAKVVFVDERNRIVRVTRYERHGRLEDMERLEGV